MNVSTNERNAVNNSPVMFAFTNACVCVSVYLSAYLSVSASVCVCVFVWSLMYVMQGCVFLFALEMSKRV